MNQIDQAKEDASFAKYQDRLKGLGELRLPFPANQISKLPKGTKAQNECAFNLKTKCNTCGGFHHPGVIHLDYVGHAALTDRLLDVDPEWNWEPISFDSGGLPLLDQGGGLWIKLTICGVTRLGYGDASGKTGGDAMKERIGDALRNAAMRFGAALELWHKGELHKDIEENDAGKDKPEQQPERKLPDYTDEKIDENIDSWLIAVKAGKHTTENIINMISTKYALTDRQKNLIKSALVLDEDKSEDIPQ